MKQIITIAAIFVFLFIFAKWGPSIPFSTTSQTKGEPFIVSGTGKVSVAPDIAKLSLGIQENGTSLKSVQDSVNKKSKTLVDSLKNLGVGEGDIKTTSYSVYPQYDYTNPGQKIMGYQVSINYVVTVKNFDKLNDIFSVATSNGANVAGGINFDLSDSLKKQKLQEAREMAVGEAKDKAQGLAKASGITLGKIINISEDEGNAPRPIQLMAKDASGAPAETSQANIQPGTTDITLTVSLSYEVR